MAVRASLFPYLVGLAATSLTLGACGDDGGGSSAGGTASGSTTQGADSGTTNDNPPGDSTATTNSTVDGTATDTGSDTETGEDTTGDPPPPECPYDPVDGMPSVTLEEVGRGFSRPVLAIGHPTEPDRLFVVEQTGTVRILEPGETEAPGDAFLTVDSEQPFGGAEYGLLGFAFHPDFPDDPRVYVNYQPASGARRTRISEFTVDAANPDAVDPGSERIVLELRQPAGNHNGGMVMFGQDGYLYIGMGDGGGGEDEFFTGRNTQWLHAKILRIGVEPDGTPDNPVACSAEQCGAPLGPFDYTIPEDNPFVGDPEFAPEIYTWGVRNPWRFAQDRQTGDIYVGDVGQGFPNDTGREEISLITSGADLGWSSMEGASCYPPGTPNPECDTSPGPNEVGAGGITMPILDYPQAAPCRSVTGGAVYRACEVPAWDGVYFYSDACTGQFWALRWDGKTVEDLGMVASSSRATYGNGWNAYGDVLFTSVDAAGGGFVHRLVPGR